MKKFRALALVLFILIPLAAGNQSVPQLINYQGRLTNASGLPVDGVSVDLTFRFYSAQTAGILYLTVSQTNVQVGKGVYNVLIGSGTITPGGAESSLAAVFQKHGEVWMSVQVGTDPEMTPRSRISSSAYALKAEQANAVDINWLMKDSDGDGYRQFEDCDDEDPSKYSGHVDICGDGIDNNCSNGDCYLAGSCYMPTTSSDMYISGNYAYVADDTSGGLYIINVSNPSMPTLVGTYYAPSGLIGVYVSGSYAYVTDGDFGLQIINVSNPSAPTLAGAYDTPSFARGVYVSGSYAYVADGYSGLQIINISNPSAPTLAGEYDTPDNAYGVYVSGSYAYVADGSGLQIINISNPSAPTLAAAYDTTGNAIYVSGIYAYVAGRGLQIINISNPSAPTLVGIYYTPSSAQGVYVSGSYAYVADGYSGLQIINISNPSAPTLAGKYDTPDDYALGVYVSGSYVYVNDYKAGLQIIYALSPP